MAVRNFWIDANIDGRKTRLSGGPIRKDGGFELTVYIRNRGGILPALYVYGSVSPDGILTLHASSTTNADNEAGYVHGGSITIETDQ